ncbi:MAG: VCBS repeat-containing protein, partial [Deltaproteobacteria bacterium]|nr:VCBS repeat-containing protein [Deltaproteobacteria bacterium]
MRARPLLIAFLAVISCWVFLTESRAGKQSLALFPPQAVGVEDGARISTLLVQALGETLRERFEVHPVKLDKGSDPGKRKQKARSLGVTYVLTGNVTRIGRMASLDITLSPTENPGKGRTVFVTVEDRRSPLELQGKADTQDLPPAYRKMATEASEKLMHLFFGDGQIGEGGARRKIPSLSGKVSRSRNIPGEVVSLAKGDTDLDGKPEIAAAYPDSIVLYRVAGENLIEKSRIAEKRGGIIHIDIADLNRNGIAEIIAVRYLSGRAVSE